MRSDGEIFRGENRSCNHIRRAALLRKLRSMTPGPIRVFLADDHAIVRSGLERLISDASDMNVVGTASSSDEVIARARAEVWDVLVLDIGLPPAGGIEVLSLLRLEKPSLAIIIFTMHPEDRLAVRLLRSGASGFINKSRPPTEVIDAIRKVSSGGRYVPPAVGELLLDGPASAGPKHETLTDREYQVFLLILEGRDPSDIAIALHLSPSTVSTHLRRIKEKLGTRTTADIIRYGFRTGLVE